MIGLAMDFCWVAPCSVRLKKKAGWDLLVDLGIYSAANFQKFRRSRESPLPRIFWFRHGSLAARAVPF